MKTHLQKTLMGLLGLGLANQLTAQFSLVETVGLYSQDIARPSVVNNTLYFTGREQGGSATDVYLWSNTGGNTSTKITLMSQLGAGINCSYFFPCNGKAFFYYSNGNSVSGYEPWITDGTAAGTMMVKDINPGTGNSVIFNGTAEAFTYNNKVYFAADNGTNGSELWVSDGTAAGTMMLKDIKVGSSGSSPANMVLYKGEIYFTAKSGSYGEIWHTDGTAAGTQKVTNPAGLQGHNMWLVPNDTCLYFAGNKSGSGDFSIWKTNGTTAGTSIMTGTLPITPLNAVNGMISNGTEVIFGFQYYSGSNYAYRLYKTNGTSIITVKDSVQCSTPYLLGNKVVFRGVVQGSGSTGAPWVTDGTTAGTFSLCSANFANSGIWRNVSPAFNNKIYLFAGSALWQTDGTTAGTTQIGGTTMNVLDFSVMGSTLYFNATNSANTNRYELFTLGTSAGIKENNPFESALLAYPQPARETVTLSFAENAGQVTMKVMDMTGKEVAVTQSEVSDHKAEINVSGLTPGIYLLQVSTEDGKTGTKKIVIAE